METHLRKGFLFQERGTDRLGVKSPAVVTAPPPDQAEYRKPSRVPRKAVSPHVWYRPREERGSNLIHVSVLVSDVPLNVQGRVKSKAHRGDH